MLHSDLSVNGIKISDKKKLEHFLELDHFSCTIGNVSPEVEYSKDRAAFIGWIDEYNDDVFYFDNGSGNDEPVDLMINVCPEGRMMCYDNEVIKDIVCYFCETSRRNPKYNWIEDER